MNAVECIKNRRSIRKFKQQPVDHSLLEEIIETASYAPSWKHTQIVRYIAVEGELKNDIGINCTSAYPRNGEIIQNAPLLIAVTVIKGRSGCERDGSFTTPRGDTCIKHLPGVTARGGKRTVTFAAAPSLDYGNSN